MSFNIMLPRTQEMKIWDSYDATENPEAKALQELFDKNLTAQFEETKKEFEEAGSKFRLTDGRIFKIEDHGKTQDVRIMLQVVAGTITWYFISGKDVTHQEERDQLYQAAAVGHLHVEDHCEKYWRGTNSLHVKKMHTAEKEAGWNHNHYRVLKDKNVDAKALKQHLEGFVEAEHEMDLYTKDLDGNPLEKFLTKQEAAQIIHKFTVHWEKVNHVGAECIKEIDGEKVKLADRKVSLLEEYMQSPSHKLTPEDIQEWEGNKNQEEPCKTISPQMKAAEKLEAIRAGMRGLGAELANTRQMEGSEMAAIQTVVGKDDKIQ